MILVNAQLATETHFWFRPWDDYHFVVRLLIRPKTQDYKTRKRKTTYVTSDIKLQNQVVHLVLGIVRILIYKLSNSSLQQISRHKEKP